MEIKILYQKFKECISISTDTRQIGKGSMFFALKGSNFDGNTFVATALESGAKYCVVDDKTALVGENCFLVDDVLKTLQELATFHRKTIDIPIIALTGSNGKTTTKELILAVLSSTFKVKGTKGNLNNHIGVPLTLLSFSDNLDFGVVEMGANHQKEIEFLSAITQPDYGLITNFGKAHLEGFGGFKGIVKGKSELYEFIKENNKTVFLNTDDTLQMEQIGGYTKKITFGSKSSNAFAINLLNADPFVSVEFSETVIKSQLIGAYNFGNIASAVAIGAYFGVVNRDIKQAITSYAPNNNRSQIIEKGGHKIILDAYNANPTSMLAALQSFKQLSSENKYLFLGDMFEVGSSAQLEHQNIVTYAEEHFKDNIYLIGENFSGTTTKSSTHKFSNFEQLKSHWNNQSLNKATVFIKGSRGMALERILELI